jgi:DNA-binding NtrC family response regulator/tetratricopeptide (TPR) repeat protein
VTLVDYVRIDEARGFEVFEHHRVLRAPPRGAAGLRAVLERFLCACGLEGEWLEGAHFAVCRGRTAVRLASAGVVVPRGCAARSWQAQRSSGALPVRAIGLQLDPPELLRGVLAALEVPAHGESSMVVGAAPGAGATTLLRLAAREARVHGVCPVCPRTLVELPDIGRCLRGRQVALLCDREANDAVISRALARLTADHAASVFVLRVAAGRERDPRVLSLEGCTPARLAAAACLSPPRSARASLDLARAAGGAPGRLASQWLERAGTVRRVLPSRWTVGGATGGWGEPGGHGESIVAEAGGWGDSGRDAAVSDLPWRHLTAGRAHEAARLFDASLRRDGWRQDTREIAASLRGLGLANLEQAHLDEALVVLQRAVTACDLIRLDSPEDPAAPDVREAETRLAHARCLLWRNQLHDAASALARIPGNPAAPGPSCVRATRYRARLAWRLGDVKGAWRALAAADRHAASPDDRAAVACDRARMTLATGDLEGCDRALAAAARYAGHCRRWMVLGAIQAARFVASDGGIPDQRVAPLVARLLRRDVPLLIRLRVQFALERAGRGRTREVTGFVERWGSAALQDGGWALPALSPKDTVMVNDLQAVLEICRDSIDALPALGDVCSVLRDRLGASIVSVYGSPVERGRLAQSGTPRFDSPELARRTLDTGLVLEPTRAPDGIEAAAPVVYAGHRIGALTCRWTIDATVDAERAHSLLLGAATALAPHVQGVSDVVHGSPRRGPDTLGLLGVSAPIVELRDRIRRVAGAPFHVLIEGESGSGKELVAKALHLAGPRAARRFCAVNCAALTDELFEAELFGHVRGAFTGAVGERAGLFEEADGGTLFLDEIGELSLRAQAKLLRAIQDAEIRRVGESLPRRVDARIVAATNRALAEEAVAGRFRADLLYRLDVIRIAVPALRDRPEDVAVIARACWTEAAARVGSRATLHVATLAALARYHWPGNVRELQNVVRALAVNAPLRGVVFPSRLPRAIAAAGGVPAGQTLDAARRSFEERFVRAALARAGDRPGRAARDLGLTRQGLRKLLRRLGIEGRRGEAASVADAGRR